MKRQLVLEYPMSTCSKGTAWERTKRRGKAGLMLDTYVRAKVAEHHWRKDHDYDRALWRYYATFASHPEGPDKQVNFAGEEEQGYRLIVPRSIHRIFREA